MTINFDRINEYITFNKLFVFVFYKREGFSKFNKIYEYEFQILQQNVTMVMTSVSGHLLNYDFYGQYKSWYGCFFSVGTCQGKARGKQNFLQVRNCEKMSGNFVVTIKFFLKMILLLATFSSSIIFVGFASRSIHSHHTFFKYFITAMTTIFHQLLCGKNIWCKYRYF